MTARELKISPFPHFFLKEQGVMKKLSTINNVGNVNKWVSKKPDFSSPDGI